MSKLFTILTLLPFLTIPACNAPQPPKPTIEGGLQLSLWSKKTGNQYIYYKLSPSGQLEFAGGRTAMFRNTKPLTIIKPQHFQQIRTIINNNQLMKAPSAGIFETGDQNIYEVDLKLDAKSHRFKVLGDTNKGVIQLQKYLDDIRKTHSDSTLLKSIDRQLKDK